MSGRRCHTRTLGLLLTLAAVVALGAASRLRPVGLFLYDKSLGDVLYAVAAYLALALLLFRARPAVVAAAALGACAAVECFKLTGLPARYAGAAAAVQWLLGTSFAWHNLACYAVGVAGAFTLDAVTRPRRDATPSMPARCAPADRPPSPPAASRDPVD